MGSPHGQTDGTENITSSKLLRQTIVKQRFNTVYIELDVTANLKLLFASDNSADG